MSKTDVQSCLVTRLSSLRFPAHLSLLVGFMAAALLAGPWMALAEEPDDQYVQVFSLLGEADSLAADGKTAPALAKYQEAHKALQNLYRDYPTWNPKLVTFRFNYIAEKTAALKAQAAAPAAGTNNTPKASAAATGDGAQMKLLEPGAEPRKVLRLHPKAGDQQKLEMNVKFGMETIVAGTPASSMKMPAMNLSMDLAVKSVSPEGDIAYEMVISDIGVAADASGAADPVGQSLKAALAGFKGTTMTGVYSSRGIKKQFEAKLPSNAAPQTRMLFDQMKRGLGDLAMPLPEESVGKGATWEEKKTVKADGITVTHTATFEITELEGDRLAVKLTTKEQAGAQKVENPAMPGVKVDLTKMSGQSTGSMTTDLGKVLPVKATQETHSESTMAMNMGGQKQAMATKVNSTVRLESK